MCSDFNEGTSLKLKKFKTNNNIVMMQCDSFQPTKAAILNRDIIMSLPSSSNNQNQVLQEN